MQINYPYYAISLIFKIAEKYDMSNVPIQYIELNIGKFNLKNLKNIFTKAD